MHDTSIKNAQRFISTYVKNEERKLVEIGSKSYLEQFNFRQAMPEKIQYIGVDFQAGLNVDIVLDDPYKLPIDDNSIDYVISSSCFEHSEFFWLSFLEITRVLKPGGLFYLNAPSNGSFHRFPVDCWRFYPDSAMSLVKWSKKNGIDCELLEQYTSNREADIWNDYVAVFVKGTEFVSLYNTRIIDNFNDFQNGTVYPFHENFINS